MDISFTVALEIVSEPALMLAPLLFNSSIPSLTRVAPIYELLPDPASTRVPRPVLVKPPLPLTVPPSVRRAPIFTSTETAGAPRVRALLITLLPAEFVARMLPFSVRGLPQIE